MKVKKKKIEYSETAATFFDIEYVSFHYKCIINDFFQGRNTKKKVFLVVRPLKQTHIFVCVFCLHLQKHIYIYKIYIHGKIHCNFLSA